MQSDHKQTTPSPLPTLLDDEELANYLGCSMRFVRRLTTERRIAYQLVGRHRLYRLEDVLTYLDNERKTSLGSDQRAAEPRRRHAGGRPKRSERGAA